MAYTVTEENYETLKARYKPAAKKLEEYLRKLLKAAKIKALFSHRVKGRESLNKKLGKPEYKDIDTLDKLCEDIKDIAGVRVAVYYPSDKWEVEALLYEYFCDVTQTTHPTEKEKKLVSSAIRFEGYSAEHYVIPIAKEPTPDINRRLPNHTSSLNNAAKQLRTRPDNVDEADWGSVRVELQVASLPLHTWSEPDHTLVYKGYSEMNEAEAGREFRKRSILDALNGHAIASEVLLEMLKWDSIDQEPFSSRPLYSTFKDDLKGFLGRIKRATCSCWFIGQNHYGLFYNQKRKIRKETQTAISESSCSINFVIANCNDKAVREDVMYGWPRFKEDWEKSLKALHTLKEKQKRVQAYVSSQVSRQSLLFFDPECSEGEVFLFRSLPGTKPDQRPRTRIRRSQHPTRFWELWGNRPNDLENLPDRWQEG